MSKIAVFGSGSWGTAFSSFDEKHMPLPRRPHETCSRSRAVERTWWNIASAMRISRVRHEALGFDTP